MPQEITIDFSEQIAKAQTKIDRLRWKNRVAWMECRKDSWFFEKNF